MNYDYLFGVSNANDALFCSNGCVRRFGQTGISGPTPLRAEHWLRGTEPDNRKNHSGAARVKFVVCAINRCNKEQFRSSGSPSIDYD